ncbi:MAG: hypothetical protein HXY34_13135 [Candidatus Thorarchaeota archaeon]|nr:hypothetical protein [Candidatus Thorarchaeota archaeon]
MDGSAAEDQSGTATNTDTQKTIHGLTRRVLTLALKQRPPSAASGLLFVLLLTLLTVLHCMAVNAGWGVYGFSFDDSWIHVQYARTIFEGYPWEYSGGIPSTGSSAPLWSVLLSPIFILGYEMETVVAAVTFISAALYVLDTFLVGELVRQHTGRWEVGLVGQVVFVITPRNTGLMLSGMETPLAMFFLLLALLWLPRLEQRYDPLLGIVAGLAYLCRPEFVLIVALCFPVRVLQVLRKRQLTLRRSGWLFSMFILAGLIALPWTLHCLNVTGLPLPDSYYAKLRFIPDEQAYQLWTGWWLAWLTGELFYIDVAIVVAVFPVLKGRPYETILASSFFLLYHLTMPATALLFDARYLVPLFDLMGIIFVVGVTLVLERLWSSGRSAAHLSQGDLTRTATVVVILILFVPVAPWYGHHLNIHANQVKNISEMQVSCARWASENLPADAVIAVYDVGAIGYLWRGTVLDVFGLVTPPVLHNCNTTLEVVDYLISKNCTHVIFYDPWIVYLRYCLSFRGWTLVELFRVTLTDNVVCGTNDMVVYALTRSG